ncbi:hypothetical protein CY652_18025 [Burkholderia sp. WAC0059]|uniref:TetR/AcrR family transcriptional regulator n=1 Tax=Burkholderia sp. WAC0059 TaxID=2066022 RepID=UPI000C7F7895|nr:TetR/AcrR family transcriptional regulator [Burkholderia sp. WAC0059]PLZ00950.1 hypothetical protein CY652_18025 [Burkholderia sp. WAC0059]
MEERKLTSRDRAQAQTRELLMASAEKLVAQCGFGGTSVGDIVADAGFTKGAFYSNFKTKEDLFLVLLQRLKQRQREALQALESFPVDDFDSVLDIVASIVEQHAGDASAPLLVAEAQLQARRDPVFAAAIKEEFEYQVGVIAGWVKVVCKRAKVQSVISPEEMARMIMALSQGLAQQPADRRQGAQIARSVLQRLFLPQNT